MVLMQEETFQIFAVLFSLVINLAVARAIYNDAFRRGMQPKGYALLACCCGWLIGLVVYYIARQNHPILAQPGVPYGGSPAPGMGTYPPGGPTPSQYPYGTPPGGQPPMPGPGVGGDKVCPSCGNRVPQGVQFCGNCGRSLS